MTTQVKIEHRKPIWMAISEFYLDTKLQDADFRRIALIILESPYSFKEVKTINKYEVFPILQPNLLSPAGEWAGFDEDWLVEKILYMIEKKSRLGKFTTEITYPLFKWMCKNYWNKLEKAYNEIKINPDSFIITCRTAFFSNLLPFLFDKATLPLYKKLEQNALDYKQKGQLQQFYGHLQEGQYYTNVWTAYFLLEKFELKGTEKLIGLNENESIAENSYRLIENHFQNFKNKEQIENCSFWLEAKKKLYNFDTANRNN
jgi:hypothetical protein